MMKVYGIDSEGDPIDAEIDLDLESGRIYVQVDAGATQWTHSLTRVPEILNRGGFRFANREEKKQFKKALVEWIKSS